MTNIKNIYEYVEETGYGVSGWGSDTDIPGTLLFKDKVQFGNILWFYDIYLGLFIHFKQEIVTFRHFKGGLEEVFDVICWIYQVL